MKLKNAELLSKKFEKQNNQMLRSKSKPNIGLQTKYDTSMRIKRKAMAELRAQLNEKDKIIANLKAKLSHLTNSYNEISRIALKSNDFSTKNVPIKYSISEANHKILQLEKKFEGIEAEKETWRAEAEKYKKKYEECLGILVNPRERRLAHKQDGGGKKGAHSKDKSVNYIKRNMNFDTIGARARSAGREKEQSSETISKEGSAQNFESLFAKLCLTDERKNKVVGNLEELVRRVAKDMNLSCAELIFVDPQIYDTFLRVESR